MSRRSLSPFSSPVPVKLTVPGAFALPPPSRRTSSPSRSFRLSFPSLRKCKRARALAHATNGRNEGVAGTRIADSQDARENPRDDSVRSRRSPPKHDAFCLCVGNSRISPVSSVHTFVIGPGIRALTCWKVQQQGPSCFSGAFPQLNLSAELDINALRCFPRETTRIATRRISVAKVSPRDPTKENTVSRRECISIRRNILYT